MPSGIYKRTAIHKKAISNGLIGDKPSTNYQAVHNFVRKRFGPANSCEQCGKNDKDTKYEWANIDGKYRRDVNDYIMLCKSCHVTRDNKLNIRIKKDLKAALDTAKINAQLSYAKRLKVGAVLSQEGHIISNGRNGTVAGADNKCEDENGNTLPTVVHAEANSILFAARWGISTSGATLVTTDSPCYECAKLIIQSGIKEVYYGQLYRETEPLMFLEEYNIKVQKIEV